MNGTGRHRLGRHFDDRKRRGTVLRLLALSQAKADKPHLLRDADAFLLHLVSRPNSHNIGCKYQKLRQRAAGHHGFDAHRTAFVGILRFHHRVGRYPQTILPRCCYGIADAAAIRHKVGTVLQKADAAAALGTGQFHHLPHRLGIIGIHRTKARLAAVIQHQRQIRLQLGQGVHIRRGKTA